MKAKSKKNDPGGQKNRKQKTDTSGNRSTRPITQTVQFETIFDHVPAALIVTDREGRIRYMNEDAKSLLGEPDGILSLEDWPLRFGLYQDDGVTLFPAADLPLGRALQGETAEAQEVLLHKDGQAQKTCISMSARPVMDKDGLITGAVAFLQDVTFRKQIELSRERYAQRIETLYQLARIIAAGNNDVKQITRSVTQLTSETIGDLSVITLLNRDGEKIIITAFDDRDPAAKSIFQEVVLGTADYPSNEGLAARVINSGEPLLIPSISREQLLAVAAPKFADFVRQVSLHSVLIVPLIGRSGIVGAINLFRHGDGKPYNTADQSFLMEIAYRTALAIENSILIESLRAEMSERLSAKEALYASEERFRSIFESTALGIKVLDLVGTILDTNPAFRSMQGYSQAELTGRNFFDFIHPEDAPRALQLLNDLKTSSLPDFRFEHRIMHKDGSVVWVKTTFTGVKKGGGDNSLAFIVGILENVSHQKQAEEEMAELKKRMQANLELERLRVAHELHDGPMQEMYSAIYRLKQLSGTADPALGAALDEVNRDIQRVLDDLRATAKELRPPAISNFGLEKAIRSHAEDFQQQHPGIKLHLSLAQDRQLLPEDVRLALFRVYQQAMMNVVRHAKASQIQVRFSFDAEEVRLEVSDNGNGFKVPPNWLDFARQGHYGLAGAAERMNAVGGVLLVESNPQNSTTVRAILSLKESSLLLSAEKQEPIIKRAKDLI